MKKIIIVIGGAIFLAAAAFIIIGTAMGVNLGQMMGIGGGKGIGPKTAQTLNTNTLPLPIPPLLQDQNPDPNKGEFQLTVQKGTMEFFTDKKTATLGYNGNYLGPVIRVHRGEEVSVNVKNNLDESTTVHWHGLEVDGEDDGGPHNAIKPGKTWHPHFTVDQPAATLWYHPHIMGKTGEQVYKGLAGLFYIDDNQSDQLQIPKTYGVDDIPLVVQDKRFNKDGSLDYNLSMSDQMMGFQGNTNLINGAVNPYLNVKAGKIRLRLLNGSNARTYDFRLSRHLTFDQIASDGGFLAQPVAMNHLTLAPGEGAEIVVDFSSLKDGDKISLFDQTTKLMNFNIKGAPTKSEALPNKLADIPKMDPNKAVVTRQFIMQGMGNTVNINGKQMDMNRIDEAVHWHDTEIWEISVNSSTMGAMAHPFHIHSTQFQILDRNGQPPAANEMGWKDTVLVQPGETVRVIATFNHPGIFMYHCHILEHEDLGMMGQFQVK
ncbi:MAG: multicopper oxidase family protein [Tuberibacillus sp.]